MQCSFCGKNIPDGETVCPRCGEKVKTPVGESPNEMVKYYNYGYYHLKGENGYSLDYQKAFTYFQKAASLGSAEAYNYMGFMYLNGYGVPHDTKLAWDYCKKALQIDPHCGNAFYNMGYILYNGIGFEQDYEAAYRLFSQAKLYGEGKTYYGYACHFMGYIMMEIFKEPAQSVDLVLEAVKHTPSIAEAWNNLGYLTELGYYNGGQTAIYYYTQSANLGYAAAARALYAIYDRLAKRSIGLERKKHQENANFWYNRMLQLK